MIDAAAREVGIEGLDFGAVADEEYARATTGGCRRI